MKKYLGSFRQNIGLKVLSVLVAIVIWYIVVDINDPVESSSFNVKVTVENEGYIANGKNIYHIEDAYKTVNVFVSANRSTLKRITADDITVTADLTQIVDLERDPVMVPLTATCSGVSQTGVSLARNAIPITIETIATREFPITVDTGDSVPSAEYEVGTTTANPDQIVINGPESIISQIDSAIARIDVTGMTFGGEKKATLILLDKSSQEISQETIEDDLTFEGDVDSISVKIELWKRQSDVELIASYSGVPAEGYHVENVSVTPDTITVVGDNTALAKLRENGNKLEIGSDQITVLSAKEDVIAEVDLAESLPEDMRLARNTADTAIVTINILSDETKEIPLDVDEIHVENLSGNLSVSYAQAELVVRIKGAGSAISALSAKDLAASIDLSGLGVGSHTVPVKITLPTGVSLDGAQTIAVSLKEKAKTESTSSSSSEGA